MPREAPVAKVAAVEAFGGIVHLGDSVDECVAAARARAEEVGATFVHPFDDPDVILGQSTLGLELLAGRPRSGAGGRPRRRRRAHLRYRRCGQGAGGRAASASWACRSTLAPRSPSRCAATPPVHVRARATIADGIAIKRPGDITLPLVRRWVDDMVVVSDEEIADAMVWLLERSKLVVEGGGAAGVAALLAGRVAGGTPSGGATVIVLSGGNVDAGLLAAVAQRNETLIGRRHPPVHADLRPSRRAGRAPHADRGGRRQRRARRPRARGGAPARA